MGETPFFRAGIREKSAPKQAVSFITAVRWSLAALAGKLLRFLGLELTWISNDSSEREDGYLENVISSAMSVPGMISRSDAMLYFSLAFGQSLKGDILEVGCWQGRSTIALGHACRLAGNGKVIAVDHFLGNPGKASHYVVNREDLSDLRIGFEENIRENGLTSYVHLNQTQILEWNSQASFRMLVLDHEHSYEAVTGVYQHLRPNLMSGGLVIFDDYDSTFFPQVVSAVRDIKKKESGSHLFFAGKVAVLRLA